MQGVCCAVCQRGRPTILSGAGTGLACADAKLRIFGAPRSDDRGDTKAPTAQPASETKGLEGAQAANLSCLQDRDAFSGVASAYVRAADDVWAWVLSLPELPPPYGTDDGDVRRLKLRQVLNTPIHPSHNLR